MIKNNYEVNYKKLISCVSLLNAVCSLNEKTLTFLMKKYPMFEKKSKGCKKEFIKISKAKKAIKEINRKIDSYFESQLIICGETFTKIDPEILELSLNEKYRLSDKSNIFSDGKNITLGCYNFKKNINNKITDVNKSLKDEDLEFIEQRMIDIVNLLNNCFSSFGAEKLNGISAKNLDDFYRDKGQTQTR